jgi:hypothetical protein
MAHNATNVRYGGQETGINQQIAQPAARRRSGRLVQQYLDALQGLPDRHPEPGCRRPTMRSRRCRTASAALDQTNLTAQQSAMQADAANRGATVDPRLAQDASNASLVRQALQGSLGALIAQHGLSAGNQASNLANVVGPGQRLQAQAQNMRQQGALQEQLTSLKGQEGSFAQTFLDSLSQNEAKNILAASIASGKDLTAQERITETTRHNKASEKNTAASRKSAAAAKGQTVNKYGYTAKQWAAYSPEERRKIMAQVKKEQRGAGEAQGRSGPSGPGSLTPVKEAVRSSARSTRSCRSSRAPSAPTTSCGCTSPTARTRSRRSSTPGDQHRLRRRAPRWVVLAEREGRSRPGDPCRRALQAAQGRPQGSGAGDVPAAVGHLQGHLRSSVDASRVRSDPREGQEAQAHGGQAAGG